MSKRKRFKDCKAAPGQPVIRKKRRETWRARHARRLQFNLNRQEVVEQWCQQAGVTITVTNEGHHWKFVREEAVMEWWPSSAKCVVDKQYRKGIHTHDVTQLLLILKQVFDPAGVYGDQQ